MKKTIKKTAVLLFCAVLILSSAACSGNDNEDPVQEGKDIDWKENELFGVAFLGYAKSLEEDGIKDALKKYQDTYTVLRGEQAVKSAATKGSEVYLIIMRYPDAVITINNLPENGGNAYGDVIYSGSSQAVIFMCNADESRNDAEVTVEYKDQTAVLIPQIDIFTCSLPAEPGVSVRNLTFPKEGIQSTAVYANSEALTGKWAMYTDFGDFTAVLQLNFDKSGGMQAVTGYYLSEVAEILEGEYCFAGPDHIKYKEGTLIFRLKLTFLMQNDPAEQGEELPLTVFSGAYSFEVNGDTLILRREGGIELFYEENAPSNAEYTFSREKID